MTVSALPGVPPGQIGQWIAPGWREGLPVGAEEDSAAPEELRCLLALLRLPGVGPCRFQELLAACGTATRIFTLSPPKAAALAGWPELARLLAAVDWAAVDCDLAWAERSPHNHILPLDHPDYPPQLRTLHDPPPLLFVKGDLRVLHTPQVAIVGSRNATLGGTRIAFDLAADLAASGLTVTSGLALGIDGAAHKGALHAGGKSVAVFGTGLARIYPAKHRALAASLVGQGALCSELPPDLEVRAANFPRRNRLIAGLALGTLVVEASLKSGSLITARLALEQGREIFAVPGSIHNPQARGCHALIRQGAHLVESAEDILLELPAALGITFASFSRLRAAEEEPENEEEGEEDESVDPVEASPSHEDPLLSACLNAMGHDPISIDELVERTGQSAQSLTTHLMQLELTGYVRAEAGGIFVREGRKPNAGAGDADRR
jgi:DNA processing protein